MAVATDTTVPADELLERLTETAMLLARRNEELEDYAALVAHELKTPLLAAISAPDPTPWIQDALELVDTLLIGACAVRAHPLSSLAECLREAARGTPSLRVELGDSCTDWIPIPTEALCIVLSNLLRNARAAGAHDIRVTATATARSWQLTVEDDGVGLTNAARYPAGAGLGIVLCRRLAARHGGILELASRIGNGTRAIITVALES